MLKRTIGILLLSAVMLTSCGKAPESTNNTNNAKNTPEQPKVVEMQEPQKDRLKTDSEGNYIIDSLPQFSEMKEGEEYAVMKTNMGDIKIRFFPEAAPNAVNNFKEHAKSGYYDGVIFHRVIPDFMIQGGDPDGVGTGGESIWGVPFKDEFAPDIRNFGGSLSMANAGKNTNGSQFFINLNIKRPDLIEQGKEAGYPDIILDKYEEVGGNMFLDYKHTVFGQIFEGMDVVEKIAAVETGSADKPKEDVVIEKITLEKYEKQ